MQWALDSYVVDDITAEASFYLIIHRPHHVGHLVSTPILLMVISSSVPLLVNIDLEPVDYIGVSGSEQGGDRTVRNFLSRHDLGFGLLLGG